MSGAFPAGKVFSEPRPKGQEGRSPPPPSAALAPLLFFPIVEDKHFLLTVLLCIARELRMDRAGWGVPTQARPAVSGPAWPLTPRVRTRPGPAPPEPPCPRLQRRWVTSTFPNCQVFCTTWIMTYFIFVFKLIYILKTSINAYTKQALHHYSTWKTSIICQNLKILQRKQGAVSKF